MNVKSGIIKKQILVWFSKRFVNLTGKELLIERTLMIKVSILNHTINNVLSNFIAHETITCDDKKPPWFNKNFINLIKNNNIFYKSHTAKSAKSEYYSKLSMKLLNPETSSKAYWSILKSFVNNKKIYIIPPLYHNGNFITDFCQKSRTFKLLFSRTMFYITEQW